MDPQAPKDLTVRAFDRRKINSQVSERLPSGVTDVTYTPEFHESLNILIHNLSAYVLSDEAGEPAVETFSYLEFLPPRWMPKWMRRRLSARRFVTLTAKPKWIYPHADIGPLGPPVGKLEIMCVGKPWARENL